VNSDLPDLDDFSFGAECFEDFPDEPEVVQAVAAVKSDRRDSDDLVKIAEQRGEVKRRPAISRRVRYHNQQCARIANFAEIGLPDPGAAYHIITTGSFNAYTIVLHTIAEFNHIEYAALATFNMHQDVIADLFDQFDQGYIRKMDIMISESVKFRMPKRWMQMIECFNARRDTHRVRVKFNWNHAKVILLKTAEHSYCITGSGNLSDNAQFEQYHITCDSPDYDFFAAWFESELTSENHKRELLLK